MNSSAVVSTPQIKGKIVFKKQNDNYYVLYEVDRVYNAQRRYNVPKRVCIGKLVGNDKTLMFPNENFTTYFPNVVVQPLEAPTVRDKTIRVGSYLAFSKIVNEYNLDHLLKKNFGDRGSFILDLASYLIVQEDNAAQYYPSYAQSHALFTKDMAVKSDSSVSRLLQEINGNQITSFLDDWNQNQDRSQQVYISYDSTNKNSQAGDLEFVEFGFPKEQKGLPIFNIGLAFDQRNQVPLFYEQYPGSINDVSQLSYLVDKVHAYGYRSIGFILDRGYFSRANIEYIDSMGFNFLMMVKGCKPLVANLISEHGASFSANRSYWIPNTGIYGKTIESKLFAEDGKTRYFHMFFSASKMASERAELEAKLATMHSLIKTQEGREFEFDASMERYFEFHYKKTSKNKKIFLFATEKVDAINEEMARCGYFCLISSKEMTASQAYHLYRSRDISEKLFRADKSFLGSKSMRVHSDQALKSKLFIEFIALIIRNRFYNLLKDEAIKTGQRRNYMTVPGAIQTLNKVQMTVRNHGFYQLDHALTKTQKTIFAAFGLSPDEIYEQAQNITVAIGNKQELIEDDDDLGYEYGTTQEPFDIW